MCYDHFWLGFPETAGFRGLSRILGGERGGLAWPGLLFPGRAISVGCDRLGPAEDRPPGPRLGSDTDCPSDLVCSCTTFMKPGAS